MAYIVNKSDGSVIATIADGTIDTVSTSITLLGKGFNNYGEIVAENWVQMVENFASPDGTNVGPANALQGQLWYDTTNAGDERLKVNISATPGSPEWVKVDGAIISATQPTVDFGKGTFWFDTSTNSLNVSTDGSTFTSLKAVITSATTPTSVDFGDLWYDTNTSELKVYSEDLHGQIGTDGFDVVGPPRYSSTEPATDRADGDFWWNSTTKQLYAFDSAESEYRLVGPATPSGITTGVTEIVGDVYGGTPVLKVVIDDEIVGIWSREEIDVTSLTPSEQAELTGFGPTIYRGLTLNSNAGPSSETTLFGGPATEAFYADLAERYAVDGPVEAGEIVSIGGEADVTKTIKARDFNVFGVVSTNPGLKLNSAAGNDMTHPYIALSGRVPCKVFGPVKKGDRLVSSGIPGVAQAIYSSEILELYPAIIGRALETNADQETKIIEITVGVK